MFTEMKEGGTLTPDECLRVKKRNEVIGINEGNNGKD